MYNTEQYPPIMAQPGQDQGGGFTYGLANDVTIRTMNASDCEFAGRSIVDGFRSKFVHSIGADNIDIARQANVEDLRLSTSRYPNIFIAEFQGQRAGVMSIKFQGDKDTISDRWNNLRCCPLIRLSLMGCLMEEKISKGHCYVEIVCVDEHFRGKGIGKMFMAAADQHARAHNCHLIYLNVAGGNRAENLYTREGYRVTGTSSSCCNKCITGYRTFKKMEKVL